MKQLIVLLTVLLSTSAMAETCQALMETRWGGITRVHTGFGYNQREACNDAMRECRFEARRYYDASCRILSRDNNRGRQCQYKLVNIRNGRVLDSFKVRAQTKERACMRAQDRCQDRKREVLRNRRRNGNRIPRLACERVGRRNNW